jgi:hypothetical protein
VLWMQGFSDGLVTGWNDSFEATNYVLFLESWLKEGPRV